MQNLLRALPLNLSYFKKLTAIKFWSFSTSKKLNLIKEPEKIDLKSEKRNNKLKTLLWLDDRIDPKDPRMDWLSYSPIGRNVNVIWLKSFVDFKNWIQTNGLPGAICFDYDLGETKNGYDCAKCLIDYCRNYHLHPPLWTSQSTDPEGKAKINRLLKNFVSSL